MIHYLTIGHFDPHAVVKKRLDVQRPLAQSFRDFAAAEFARSYNHSHTDEDGKLFNISEWSIRCLWFQFNKRFSVAERVALCGLLQYGCLVVDIEHGRIVHQQELELKPWRG